MCDHKLARLTCSCDQRQANRILAHVRPGGGRSTADFNKLCTSVTEAWEKIVNPHKKKSEDLELRAIFVLGTIIAGSEAGFELPPVREQWTLLTRSCRMIWTIARDS